MVLAYQVRAELERLGCKIRTSCDIKAVLTSDDGRVTVTSGDGSEEVFDKCILAMHAPDALRLLGEQVTFDETRVLGAFRYVYRFIIHTLFSFLWSKMFKVIHNVSSLIAVIYIFIMTLT